MRDLLEMRQQSDARRLVVSRLQVQILPKKKLWAVGAPIHPHIHRRGRHAMKPHW